MKCDFCNKVMPKDKKCTTVFQALECQQKKYEDAKRDLEKLENVSLKFFDFVNDFLAPHISEMKSEYKKVYNQMAELLGHDTEE